MKKVLVAIPDGNIKSTFMPKHIQSYAEDFFDVSYNTLHRQFTKEELKKQLAEYDAVITGWGTPKLDQQVLEENDRLRLIVHTGGTVGNLVDEYAYQHKIKVFSGNLLYAESVAEGTIAYMLTALRRIPEYIAEVKNGHWRTETDVWEGLLDRTVGIVGFGTISKILIEMLQVFRVNIKVYSHYSIDPSFLEKNHCKEASLEEIFSSCDIVSVHSALNSENRNLIQKKHFEMLKDGALFINTSRGAVIDEEGLIEELKKNRFRAVMDVFMKEPLSVNSELRKLDNLYAIPHMAGPTLDRRELITKALINEMRRFFDGESEFRLEITEKLAERMTKM